MGEGTGPYTLEEFTASDGYRWRYRRYPAQGAVKAELVFIHGIQSHAGWYENSCSQLAQAGFAVAFLDRRGSGLNALGRGDAPGFRRLLDDLAEYLRRSRVPCRVAMRWDGCRCFSAPSRGEGNLLPPWNGATRPWSMGCCFCAPVFSRVFIRRSGNA